MYPYICDSYRRRWLLRAGFLREFAITARERERLWLHGERDLAPTAEANAVRSQAAKQAFNPESVMGVSDD